MIANTGLIDETGILSKLSDEGIYELRIIKTFKISMERQLKRSLIHLHQYNCMEVHFWI